MKHQISILLALVLAAGTAQFMLAQDTTSNSSTPSSSQSTATSSQTSAGTDSASTGSKSGSNDGDLT